MLSPIFFKTNIIVCIFFLPLVLCAQHFNVKLYTVHDGLPSTETIIANQDNYGYLWVSTMDGFSSFDGRQFTNYSIADGLPAFGGSCIFQDSYNRLWAGTNAGMVQFKNNRFISYPVSDSLKELYVFNFFETSQKQLWALTNRGVYEFEDSLWKKLFLFKGFENSMCRCIVEVNGDMYALLYNTIFFKKGKGAWMKILPQSENFYCNNLCFKNGKIWVSTNDNLLQLKQSQLITLFEKGKIKTGFFLS